MEIRKVPVSEINPSFFNPRLDLKPGDPAYEKLKRSIKEFGYIDPIIWNPKTGNLVGGHQRFKVLVEQGMKEVEVSVVNLSPEKEKALNLALNKIGEGSWDNVKLASLLEELEQLPDFDVGLTGFESPEISSLFDHYLSHGGEDDFDEGIDHSKEAITQLGDVVNVGCHKLLCADVTNLEQVKTLMGDERASMIFSDPPYLAKYVPGNRPNPKKRKAHKGEMIQNDSMPQEEYEKFLSEALKNQIAQLLPGSALYIWNGFVQFAPMIEILKGLNVHVSNVISWIKPSICLSFSDYNFRSEFCVYGYLKGEGKHRWFGPASEENVWEFPRANQRELIHQNQKPTELAKRALVNSSIRGNIILDGFLGSGSTMVACEVMKRRCFGVEIEPHYCDQIIYRMLKIIDEHDVDKEVLEKYKGVRNDQ